MPNWLDVSFKALIYLIMVFGLVGMVIPVYPGVVIIWAAALVHGLVTGFAFLETWVLVLLTLLMIAGTLVDNVLMGGKARKSGASWLAIALALVSGLAGTFLFPPFGGIIASPLVLFILEVIRHRDSAMAWKTTRSLLSGWGLSFLARLVVGLIMIMIWAVWGVR
ncbi:MAG: DUF456 domain-containing protein [Anaerolineales bacterium]|nr:DUF456 domain-containing protein [Anaerolineales bacterium]